MIKAFLILFITLSPYMVQCPVDNGWASATGKTREVGMDTECEYRHIWIHYDGSIMHDDKHVFWQQCKVQP